MIKSSGAMKIYVFAKTINVSYIIFRTLCRNAKGEISPC
jgi:hypothetical protein